MKKECAYDIWEDVPQNDGHDEGLKKVWIHEDLLINSLKAQFFGMDGLDRIIEFIKR